MSTWFRLKLGLGKKISKKKISQNTNEVGVFSLKEKKYKNTNEVGVFSLKEKNKENIIPK